MSGITVDDQNRALFRSNTGYIYCVDNGGSLAWSYLVGGVWDYCTPSLGPTGNVYVGNTLGVLYCLDSEGNYQWSHDYSLGYIGGGIAIQEDSSILFTTHDGYLVKTFPNGTVDWTFPTGSSMPDGPSVAIDGTIYVANHGGRVYAVDQNGGEVWITQVGSSEMSATPALGQAGLFIGDWGGNVYRLNYPDGSVEWTTHLSVASISSFAAVDCDGYLYIGSRDDYLYCLNQVNGDIEWSYLTCGDIGTMSPVLDGGGRVYTGSYCGHFYCFDKTSGDLLWERDLELPGLYSMYCKSPAITDESMLYVGSNHGLLFAFFDE
jgi:outer membrane protein assembly factor BamB